MRESGEEHQLCPCYKECKEFHKLLELKESGLMVYCHRRRTVDVRQGECAINTSHDVFILDNKKNVKITTSELTTELEKKNISCPRCREIFKHAQELMQKVKSIDRRTVMGICDHCRKNAQTSKKPFCACDEIVKKYKSVKDTQKENIKTNVKMWLSKLGHFLKDEITLNKPKQIKTRSFSDIQINQGLRSPASKHEPEIQQMFYPEMQKSDINLNLEMSGTDFKEGVTTQTVTFAQPIEPVETYTQTTFIPGTSMIDSDTTIGDTYVGVKDLPRPSLKDRKQEEISKVDIPSMDAKEALKRRHDLTLRHMMGFQKDSVVPYSVTERPEIYEIPKKAPWEQKEPTSEYGVEPEMDIKMPIPTKTKPGLSPRGISDPDYISNKPVTYGSSRTSQKDLQELGKVSKYDHDKIKKGLSDSGKRRKEIEKWGNRYIADETLKLQRSVTIFGHKIKNIHVTKSKSIPIETARNVLEPQYSFLFPKETKREGDQITLHVTSSLLIRETQEKFHLQAEIEKRRQEELRQQKLEQEQKKKLAREQKKLQAEEERRQAAESKKYAEAEEEKKKAAEKKALTKDLETKPKIKFKDHTSEKEGELISESEQKGKVSDESEVTKKELKSKSQRRDKTDEDGVLGKTKKDIKEKLEPKKKGGDEVTEKGTKGMKDKSEPKKKGGDVVSEKETKVMKDKSEPKKKGGDEVTEKGTKDMKEKLEPKKKGGDEVTEKAIKEMKDKPEEKTKDNDLMLQAMKTKKEPKTKDTDEEKEKDVKDLKSPTKQKTKMDKDNQLSGKEEQEKEQQIKREKEKQLTEQKERDKLQKEKEEQEKKLQKEKEEQEKKLQKEKEEQEKKLQLQKEHEVRLKQAEDLKKEREASKQQKNKEKENLSKETDAPSKKGKRTDEKDVPKGDIQKSMKKETTEAAEEEKDPKRKPSKLELPKDDKAVEEFKKLQAEHLKEKEERLKKKRQEEYEAQVAKAKEDTARKIKQLELSMRDVKLEKVDEDEILKMVRIKQAAAVKACEIDADLLHEHKCHHHNLDWECCPLCLNSELELECLSLEQRGNLPTIVITDMIIGEQIIKNKRRRLPKPKETKDGPSLYHKKFFGQSESAPIPIEEIIPQEAEPVQKLGAAFLMSKKNAEGVEVESSKGILRYALSDRTYIEKGWTMLPTEKVVRKMNVYRMRPAHPEFDWFEHNKKKRLMTYDTGERLAEFDDNGRGRLYYRSGRLALDYYDAEETNAQQRFVTYSSGEPDERGRTHPITILATFDYLGNGIVFDHAGKIRLKYNQTEGVVLDRGIGPVSHWKWHTLNDPPVLQQVMIDTQMSHKDPHIYKLGSANEQTTRPDNEEMLAIEFDNFIKEKSKKLSQKFKPFQIKMKALKINEHFSLKVLDQATVYLIFRDGSTNVKLNIGMILDHQEIVDTDTAEVGEVSNSLERFPARTDSLAGLQRSVAYAQRYERQYTERERRLRPPEPCGSADKLTAAASRPMRPPFRTVPPEGTSSSTSTGYCSRKPANNLYYNTRLL